MLIDRLTNHKVDADMLHFALHRIKAAELRIDTTALGTDQATNRIVRALVERGIVHRAAVA